MHVAIMLLCICVHFDAHRGTLNKASLKTGSGQLHTHLGS